LDKDSTSVFRIPEVKKSRETDFTSVFGITEVKYQRGGNAVITSKLCFKEFHFSF
jgi:hypothetical protein